MDVIARYHSDVGNMVSAVWRARWVVGNMVSALWRGSRWVLIALNGRSMATDGEWQEYLTLADQMFVEVADDLTRVRALSISDGGAPTSRQRQALVARFPDRQFPVAVVTSSRLARGIGTALAWFYPAIRTFGPREFTRALVYLGIPDAEVPALWRAIVEANERISVATVLEIGSQTGLSRCASH